MISDILEVNDFSIIVNVTEIIPPLTLGKYEAKVTKIYDNQKDEKVNLTPENTWITWGKTEEEAYAKSQNLSRKWAVAQPEKR